MLKKGFTLIELLVVVLIIGILVAIALPQYTRAVERSRAAEAWTVLGNLLTAERVYQMSHGRYTGVVTDLDLLYPAKTGATDTLATNSFDIRLEPENNGELLTITAIRQNGVYGGCGFSYGLTKTGALTGPTPYGEDCATAYAAFAPLVKRESSEGGTACPTDEGCMLLDGDCVCSPD